MADRNWKSGRVVQRQYADVNCADSVWPLTSENRAILDAARTIFVDGGYENFSMRKLAQGIEYSPGRYLSAFQEQGRAVRLPGDFPQLLAQGGTLGADVVLDPSNDWPAIDPWHTQMASFRAIEQGFNLVRQTNQGLSAAFDYQGRRLAAMDHYQTTDYAMVSQVHTRGARTVYSRLTDWFAWMCMAVLALLTLRSLRRRRPDSAVQGRQANCLSHGQCGN
jgi:Bacterial regulatory proteins, tetR family